MNEILICLVRDINKIYSTLALARDILTFLALFSQHPILTITFYTYWYFEPFTQFNFFNNGQFL